MYSSEIVQNGFPSGYFWFCIHYWWEQAKKTSLKFFRLKGWKVFEPHHRLKGGPKCGFWGFYSVFYSFLTRKCLNHHFENFYIFWSQTPSTPLRSSKMVFQGVIVDSASITGEKRPKKGLWNFWGWKGGRCLSHFIGSRVVQNAVFGGYSRFYIHFWPENAEKTTLEFWDFLVPHSSEIIQNDFQRRNFSSCIHSWWEQAQKIHFQIFGQKGGSWLRHFIGSRAV